MSSSPLFYNEYTAKTINTLAKDINDRINEAINEQGLPTVTIINKDEDNTEEPRGTFIVEVSWVDE